MTITKGEDGKLCGFTPKDHKAYLRFRSLVEGLEIGELYTVSTWFPRNPKLHRLHFAVIKAIYEAQEQFEDPDDLRKWFYVGAGYADFLPGPRGKAMAIPKSIAFDKIDDADFSELHAKVVDFIRSDHCRRFLWPHLDDGQTYETIEILLTEFERE